MTDSPTLRTLYLENFCLELQASLFTPQHGRLSTAFNETFHEGSSQYKLEGCMEGGYGRHKYPEGVCVKTGVWDPGVERVVLDLQTSYDG